MLIKKKGNLLDMFDNHEFDMIIHGCNCFCTMGSGIARQIAEKYPSAVEADYKTVRGDIGKLGTFTSTDVVQGKIINAYTQFSMGGNVDHFEYDAFRLILRKIRFKYPGFRVGLPYIGMGLAGGNAQVIMKDIEYFAEEYTKMGGTVTLVEYK